MRIVNCCRTPIYYAIITRLDASVMIGKKSIYLRCNCRYILFLGIPKGKFGTLLCVQSVVCYTFTDGAGVKIY